ncbi:MAG: preprotein translocase subunit YajC [Lachnospiraceae bacterium]|nr:preprotein translocase subunit YajC [Lachnospiraceae bacterium]MCR5390496.1 preprotein translocase subunit YajC [Lachnospiraceae bacterium]
MGYSYLISLVLMVVIFYFLLIRPQRKEQKKTQDMLQSMEVGDVVVTTSGFYGVLIDITEEDVIVEFGSNKNCRIPMRKSAIAQVEKADDGTSSSDDSSKKEKK